MNIALCFSGFVRTLEICYPSLKEVIIEPLQQKYDVDIFGSFPNNSDSLKLLAFNHIEIVEDLKEDNLSNLYLSKMRPSLNVEQFNELVSYLRQWKSWQNVSNLMCRSEPDKKYDWVFRMRTDQVFQGKIEDLTGLNNSNLYCPNHDNNGGVNDCFAFSSSQNMKIYLDLIEYVDEYLRGGTRIHAETMLFKHLQTQNIRIARTGIIALTNRPMDFPRYPGLQRINYN